MGGTTNSTSTSQTQPRPATTNNPFYSTKTDFFGNTTTNFKKGTAGEQAYNYVNKNLQGLLNRYMNPSLNNPTDQAKLALFRKQQQENLQNDIIAPLAANNMLRSSQATDMYNNLSNQAADYTNQLLAQSQDNTWNMINNLVGLYTQAYQGMANDASQNMNYSIGSGTTTTNSTGQS